MTFLETEVKMKLKCNVYNNTTMKEEYSSITILSLTLFWAADFLQINYASEMMFCNVNDVVIIIKWAFSIKSVNNDLSVTWESENEV